MFILLHQAVKDEFMNPRSINKKRALKQKRGTTMTFSADDLTTLVHLVNAGMVLIPLKHPVTARLKAALTRLGLTIPPRL